MKPFYLAVVAALMLVARPMAQSQPAPDILGAWDFTTVSPLGANTNTMEVIKDGEALKAMAKGPDGERPYDKIEITGTAVKIVLTIDYEGSPMIITYTGTTDAKSMSGDADFGGLAQGTWSAIRK